MLQTFQGLKLGLPREDRLRNFIQASALDFLQFLGYTPWKLGLFTRPIILSQIGVLGLKSISEAREIQIEFHIFNWIEY